MKQFMLCVSLLYGSNTLAGPVENFLVLGVIASSKVQSGVALMKNMNSKRTFAIREGNEFGKALLLTAVSRKFVELKIAGKTYRHKVGDDTATVLESSKSRSAYLVNNADKEISVRGNEVKVTSAYKEHLIKSDLSKILMQAAAVPKYDGGRLAGFQLWEIEPESVFEMVGLKDGDLITSINGVDVLDVSMTIKHLTALKTASEATFDFIRDGTPQKLKIVVQ